MRLVSLVATFFFFWAGRLSRSEKPLVVDYNYRQLGAHIAQEQLFTSSSIAAWAAAFLAFSSSASLAFSSSAFFLAASSFFRLRVTAGAFFTPRLRLGAGSPPGAPAAAWPDESSAAPGASTVDIMV